MIEKHPIRDRYLMPIALAVAAWLGLHTWRTSHAPSYTLVASLGGGLIAYAIAWVMCQAFAMVFDGIFGNWKIDATQISLEDANGGSRAMQYLRPWILAASRKKNGHDWIAIRRSEGMPVFPDTQSVPTFDELVNALRRVMIATDRVKSDRGRTQRGVLQCTAYGRDIDVRVTISGRGARQKVTLFTIASRRTGPPLRRGMADRV